MAGVQYRPIAGHSPRTATESQKLIDSEDPWNEDADTAGDLLAFGEDNYYNWLREVCNPDAHVDESLLHSVPWGSLVAYFALDMLALAGIVILLMVLSQWFLSLVSAVVAALVLFAPSSLLMITAAQTVIGQLERQLFWMFSMEVLLGTLFWMGAARVVAGSSLMDLEWQLFLSAAFFWPLATAMATALVETITNCMLPWRDSDLYRSSLFRALTGTWYLRLSRRYHLFILARSLSVCQSPSGSSRQYVVGVAQLGEDGTPDTNVRVNGEEVEPDQYELDSIRLSGCGDTVELLDTLFLSSAGPYRFTEAMFKRVAEDSHDVSGRRVATSRNKFRLFFEDNDIIVWMFDALHRVRMEGPQRKPRRDMHGQVYVQANPELLQVLPPGIRSYHFDGKEPFLSFRSAPVTLEDGSRFAGSKVFKNWHFDSATRTFAGSIDWEEGLRGVRQELHSLTFDRDFTQVASGSVEHVRARDSEDHEPKAASQVLGKDVVYKRWPRMQMRAVGATCAGRAAASVIDGNSPGWGRLRHLHYGRGLLQHWAVSTVLVATVSLLLLLPCMAYVRSLVVLQLEYCQSCGGNGNGNGQEGQCSRPTWAPADLGRRQDLCESLPSFTAALHSHLHVAAVEIMLLPALVIVGNLAWAVFRTQAEHSTLERRYVRLLPLQEVYVQQLSEALEALERALSISHVALRWWLALRKWLSGADFSLRACRPLLPEMCQPSDLVKQNEALRQIMTPLNTMMSSVSVEVFVLPPLTALIPGPSLGKDFNDFARQEARSQWVQRADRLALESRNFLAAVDVRVKYKETWEYLLSKLLDQGDSCGVKALFDQGGGSQDGKAGRPVHVKSNLRVGSQLIPEGFCLTHIWAWTREGQLLQELISPGPGKFEDFKARTEPRPVRVTVPVIEYRELPASVAGAGAGSEGTPHPSASLAAAGHTPLSPLNEAETPVATGTGTGTLESPTGMRSQPQSQPELAFMQSPVPVSMEQISGPSGSPSPRQDLGPGAAGTVSDQYAGPGFPSAPSYQFGAAAPSYQYGAATTSYDYGAGNPSCQSAAGAFSYQAPGGSFQYGAGAPSFMAASAVAASAGDGALDSLEYAPPPPLLQECILQGASASASPSQQSASRVQVQQPTRLQSSFGFVPSPIQSAPPAVRVQVQSSSGLGTAQLPSVSVGQAPTSQRGYQEPPSSPFMPYPYPSVQVSQPAYREQASSAGPIYTSQSASVPLGSDGFLRSSSPVCRADEVMQQAMSAFAGAYADPSAFAAGPGLSQAPSAYAGTYASPPYRLGVGAPSVAAPVGRVVQEVRQEEVTPAVDLGLFEPQGYSVRLFSASQRLLQSVPGTMKVDDREEALPEFCLRFQLSEQYYRSWLKREADWLQGERAASTSEQLAQHLTRLLASDDPESNLYVGESSNRPLTLEESAYFDALASCQALELEANSCSLLLGNQNQNSALLGHSSELLQWLLVLLLSLLVPAVPALWRVFLDAEVAFPGPAGGWLRLNALSEAVALFYFFYLLRKPALRLRIINSLLARFRQRSLDPSGDADEYARQRRAVGGGDGGIRSPFQLFSEVRGVEYQPNSGWWNSHWDRVRKNVEHWHLCETYLRLFVSTVRLTAQAMLVAAFLILVLFLAFSLQQAWGGKGALKIDREGLMMEVRGDVAAALNSGVEHGKEMLREILDQAQQATVLAAQKAAGEAREAGDVVARRRLEEGEEDSTALELSLREALQPLNLAATLLGPASEQLGGLLEASARWRRLGAADYLRHMTVQDVSQLTKTQALSIVATLVLACLTVPLVYRVAKTNDYFAQHAGLLTSQKDKHYHWQAYREQQTVASRMLGAQMRVEGALAQDRQDLVSQRKFETDGAKHNYEKALDIAVTASQDGAKLFPLMLFGLLINTGLLVSWIALAAVPLVEQVKMVLPGLALTACQRFENTSTFRAASQRADSFTQGLNGLLHTNGTGSAVTFELADLLNYTICTPLTATVAGLAETAGGAALDRLQDLNVTQTHRGTGDALGRRLSTTLFLDKIDSWWESQAGAPRRKLLAVLAVLQELRQNASWWLSAAPTQVHEALGTLGLAAAAGRAVEEYQKLQELPSLPEQEGPAASEL